MKCSIIPLKSQKLDTNNRIRLYRMFHHYPGKIVRRRNLVPRSATDGVRDGAEGNQRGIPLRTVEEGVQLAEGRAGIKRVAAIKVSRAHRCSVEKDRDLRSCVRRWRTRAHTHTHTHARTSNAGCRTGERRTDTPADQPNANMHMRLA